MENIFRATKLVKPSYDSPVTDLIIDLEKLRTKIMSGTTNYFVFFQIKNIFHTLESIGSARIEGNNTTISDYLQTKLENREDIEEREGIKEIDNIEEAINFIESTVMDSKIDKPFISELHKIVVSNLDYIGGEGDKNPGSFRHNNVEIKKSDLKPIDWVLVDEYMDELIHFINKNDLPKYDLLKIAIVHHRFLWIHPFRNGNGRTARLITYAMLVKYGFNVNSVRILNPTAIFCNTRGDYYNNLARADKHTDEGLLAWVEYVLRGLRIEIEKVDALADYNYLKKQILLPAIDYAYEKEKIKEIEVKILKVAIEKQILVANDLRPIFHNKRDSEISRQIKFLTDKGMLEPIETKARKYRLKFYNNYLLGAIIHLLGENGFLPDREDLLKIKGA